MSFIKEYLLWILFLFFAPILAVLMILGIPYIIYNEIKELNE